MAKMKPVVVDLSHHDNVKNFKLAYKDGLRGIIHKATQGTSYVDPTYESRKPKAIAAGFLWGAYHFGTDSDVDEQVSHFLDTIGDANDTLIALDYEPNPSGGTMSLDQAREWIEKVEEKTGQSVVLYSGHLIKQELGDDKDGFWGKRRLWLAQYGNNAKLPDAWDKYWIWQYTGDGVGPEPHSVNGITGDALDLNVYSGKDISSDWIVSTKTETNGKDEKPNDTPVNSGKKEEVVPVILDKDNEKPDEEEKVGPIHISKNIILTDAEMAEADGTDAVQKTVDVATPEPYVKEQPQGGFWRSLFARFRLWK